VDPRQCERDRSALAQVTGAGPQTKPDSADTRCTVQSLCHVNGVTYSTLLEMGRSGSWVGKEQSLAYAETVFYGVPSKQWTTRRTYGVQRFQSRTSVSGRRGVSSGTRHATRLMWYVQACAEEPKCPTCAGKSVIECPVCGGRGVLGRTIPCSYCKGRKQITCPVCVSDQYEATWEAETIETSDPELESYLPPNADERVRALYRSHLDSLRRERRGSETPGTQSP